MLRYSFPLALFAAAILAIPASAQQNPQPRRWTNADMDDLRARVEISIVGIEPGAAPTAAALLPSITAAPVFASRMEDPAWYAEQAADLQAQLATQSAALAQAQTSLTDARSLRGTTGSIYMLAGDIVGITPDEVIANLQAQVRETQTRLGELADLARRNDIAPGVLRAAAG
jgi:hypothetical protein